jgi:hypothetical protein
MKYLVLILLFSQTALALSPLELSDEERNPDTEQVLIKKPEKYLRNESMIYDLDNDLGIRDQRKYTGTDGNKISVGASISSDYEHLDELLGFDFNYMHRTKNYSQLWYGFQIFQNNTFFDAITQNQDPEAGDDVNADSAFQRPTDAKASVLAGGLGVGYRFKLLMEFLPTEDVFESVDVYVNYLTMKDKFLDANYKGYGLTTTYGIHKRASARYFYGGKMTYNLGSVTRDAIGEESKSERSFALGWLTLGLELGFFF